MADPAHRWHAIAKAEGVKRYMNDEMMLVSPDGLRWEIDLNAGWGQPHWHPEPPIFGFYHREAQRHAMTVRPGWGDRRTKGDILECPLCPSLGVAPHLVGHVA